MLRSILIVLALGLPLLTGAAQAQDTRTERVEFARGESAAEVKGRVKGQDVVEYRIGALAGQEMAILLRPDRPVVAFDLLPPGGGKALTSGGGDQTGPVRVLLPDSGDYRLRLHLTKAAARKGTRVAYRVEISVTSPAETMAGGPDVWEVTGVAPGDPLNLRAGPSTRDPILARLPAGTLLRNLGCRELAGALWCRVEHAGPPAVTGWVSGRFLREAAPAESMAGGPVVWEVTGVAPGDPLNLRAGPSTRDPILARLPAGMLLSNLGCRELAGALWCRVEHAGPPAVTGWVSGRFLREAPSEAAMAEAAPVAPAFAETGRMPCRIGADPAASCTWGLVAAGTGPAELHVTLPDGASRVLALHPAGPRPLAGIADMVWLRTATGIAVTLNSGREGWEIPAALLPR